MAVGSQIGMVALWDLDKGNTPVVLEGHKLSITAVAFSPDGRTSQRFA